MRSVVATDRNRCAFRHHGEVNPRRTPASRSLPALAAAALSLGALVGCSEVEDAVRDTASEAGCQVAQEAVDGITGEARQAVDDLGADPAAAEQELRNLRDAVATAADGLSGEVGTHLEEAEAALDDLVAQAEAAADGTQVDEAVVQSAESELDTAVDELTQVC
ncbi:plasmid stabilization system protein ParE [Nocardioides zeae]|uniref:Plasmid stabilization system protein ParE n=1 Tax=Nocardioides zeae TaxID=1457234 RepID=A0AAJ1X124_9ACTN|nr:plasmid stabilization system protein ParE [Nocardioides zeae]